MKHCKEKLVPEHVEQKLDKTTCDICQNVIRSDCYDVNEVEIHRKTGSQYPEGGSGQKFEPDICPKCFDNKIIPFLENLGVKIKWEEWDWG